MPKTKLQNIIFTLIMAFVMVYAMVCYNIALDKGGMTNEQDPGKITKEQKKVQDPDQDLCRIVGIRA